MRKFMSRSYQAFGGRFGRDWRRRVRAIAVVVIGLVVMAHGQAQSIDTGLARATVGQPLQLVLRVRAFDGGPAGLGRDCVRAEVRQGGDAAPHQPLTWTRTARAIDGETWVTLSDPQPVREPLLHVRAALVCGAPYTREFTLLADAPDPSTPAVRPAAPASAPVAHRTVKLAAVRPAEPRLTADLEPPAAGPPASTASAPRGPDLTARPIPPLLAPTPPSSSPLSDAFLQLWHQDMRALHDEQRQSRALLASLSARLERAEREASQLAAIAGAAVLSLLGLTVGVRLWHNWRRPRIADVWPAPTRSRSLRRSSRAADQEPLIVGTPSQAHVTPDLAGGSSAAQAATEATRADAMGAASAQADPDEPLTVPWPSSGHSQAALDETHHAELLDQVDRMAAEGYLGASVAVLESALQGRVGKSPGILLRLLDHYGALQQPWNRDRVGAELTAIYNVELPSTPVCDGDGESQADEGPSLDAIEPTWSSIESSWATPQASAALACTLVRPSPHPPLSLAAFRDALWLHTVSAERESVSLDRFQLDLPTESDRVAATTRDNAGVRTDGEPDAHAAIDTALPELTWTLEPVSP
jgi:hypothetical protein